LDRLVLQQEGIRVEVDAAYGGRVTCLLDTRNGRQWMTQGERSASTGEDAVYRGAEAVGWDECFPTVSAWDAAATAWGLRLRDHGDLWGRPWSVNAASTRSLALSYSDPQFLFTRELTLEPAALVARYRVDNLGGDPLPWLWALHALLAVEPGDRIDLPGVETVDVAYLARGGNRIGAKRLPWNGPNGVLPHPLAEVQPKNSLVAGKFYARGLPGGRARIGHDGRRLEIGWDESISDLGIWITYGAWPEPGGHYEVALEPTSAAADHVGQVIAAGAPMLRAGASRSWTVTLRFVD
jgi:galactose mutarotase-like enzyme